MVAGNKYAILDMISSPQSTANRSDINIPGTWCLVSRTRYLVSTWTNSKYMRPGCLLWDVWCHLGHPPFLPRRLNYTLIDVNIGVILTNRNVTASSSSAGCSSDMDVMSPYFSFSISYSYISYSFSYSYYSYSYSFSYWYPYFALGWAAKRKSSPMGVPPHTPLLLLQ